MNLSPIVATQRYMIKNGQLMLDGPGAPGFTICRTLSCPIAQLSVQSCLQSNLNPWEKSVISFSFLHQSLPTTKWIPLTSPILWKPPILNDQGLMSPGGVPVRAKSNFISNCEEWTPMNWID